MENKTNLAIKVTAGLLSFLGVMGIGMPAMIENYKSYKNTIQKIEEVRSVTKAKELDLIKEDFGISNYFGLSPLRKANERLDNLFTNTGENLAYKKLEKKYP